MRPLLAVELTDEQIFWIRSKIFFQWFYDNLWREPCALSLFWQEMWASEARFGLRRPQEVGSEVGLKGQIWALEARFGLWRLQGGGRMDVLTFRRTTAALLPFDSTHTSPFNKNQLKQGKGTDDHILPVGDWLNASSHLYKRLCPSIGPLVRNAFVKSDKNAYFLPYTFFL